MNYTYLLVSLHYEFRSMETPVGWKFILDNDCYWQMEGDAEILKTAKEVYEMPYFSDQVREKEIPVMVGSKAALTKYVEGFSHRYPDGALIREIPLAKEETQDA